MRQGGCVALQGSARAYAPREAGSILHIGKFYPPHRGGMESHVYDLAVRQARTGNVRVIAASDNLHAEISEPEGVQLHRVGRLATVASMPVCPKLVAAIRNAPANLVHMHTPNPGAALAFLLSGHAGKLVITHHADTMGRKLLRKLSDPFVVRAMQHASRIIVTSGRYLNSSPELAPFRDKCRVIPLGIDVRAQNPMKVSDVRDLRERFGDRIIVAVGRLVPYKGFDVLIRAMRRVDAHLLLIGSGPLAAKLGSLAAESGVAHKVTMLDRVGDLAPYFAVASLFVLPSVTRAEAFGIVQVEAMAAGLPVINTDLDSGVPEVSRHAETGFTVPPGDAVALAYAVALLLERNELRAQFAAAAAARARTEFSADRMAARTMSLYDEVLDSARYAA
jgi:glycosyltransferase involved in cell wall biosynthesis